MDDLDQDERDRLKALRNFKGYAVIRGPEQLQFDPNHPGRSVNSWTSYLGWHTRAVTAAGIDPWDSRKEVTARINHGRWIVDCFWCGGGILTRPDWAVAFCATCGARYARGLVVFPNEKDRLRIEAALLVRVRRDQQHWDHTQTAEDLEEENKTPEVMTVEKMDILNRFPIELPKPAPDEIETE